jgi:hypothetical protein
MLTVLTQEVSSSGNNWEAKPSDLVCSAMNHALEIAQDRLLCREIFARYFICCN